MNRRILFALCLSAVSSFAFSQTNTFPSSGNVGIGTTSPAAILHLHGANTRLRIGGTLNDQMGIDFDANSGTVYHRIESHANNGFFDFIAGASGGGHNLRFFTDGGERLRITSDGKLGVGTTTPQTMLDVNGQSTFRNNVTANFGVTNRTTQMRDDGFYISRTSDGLYVSKIIADNSMHYHTRSNHMFYNDGNLAMVIYEGAKVGIGTSQVNDANYKLFVETGIRTRKIKVDQQSWPDYVFHGTYNLRPLSEVESFIKKYQHLPDVPSAAQVTAEGIDLGDNQAVLLKKIEELTLYLIEQKKEIENLKKEVSGLKKSNR
jgi:hypothetical protein